METNKNLKILSERYDDNQFEMITPYPAHLKAKIVALAELCYRDNIQSMPPNLLFSIIKSILSEGD
jgi:hypothetical protein